MNCITRIQICSALAFAICVFIIHSTSRVIISSDSQWSLYVAQSILREGDINLDEYRPRIRQMDKFGVRRSAGHVYNFFPIGASLLALPFVAAYEIAPQFTASILPGVDYAETTDPSYGVLAVRLQMERAVASFYVAAATFLILLIALPRIGLSWALVLGVTFAFASPAWSTASRGLWQHGPSMFALALAIWSLTKAGDLESKDGERNQIIYLLIAGFALGLSYIIRPTNSLSIVGIGLYTLWRFRRRSIAALFGLSIALAPFFLLNLELYGRMLPPYFRSARLGETFPSLLALSGTMTSPNRGLLIFCPWVIFSIWGLVLGCEGRERGLYITLSSIIAAHWFVISMFPIWWGGHSYGPRLFCDVMPYLVLGFIPLMEQLKERLIWDRLVFEISIAITIFIAIIINYRGATSYGVHGWNVSPVNVDSRPEKIWDWQDMQIGR